MVRLVFCARRLPQLSREEFQRYWRETHGPLVRSHARVLRIRRYVQLHTAPDPENDALRASRGGPEAFDGVAELWWDSRADLDRALATPAGLEASRALLEDERRFIDLEQSGVWWVGEEHVVIDG
jgi:uncharacterized protein (TIGR02118 family)